MGEIPPGQAGRMIDLVNDGGENNNKAGWGHQYNRTDYRDEYVYDITSQYQNVLMEYGSHYQTQQYTYGVGRIAVDFNELDDANNGWIPKTAPTVHEDNMERLYYIKDELGTTKRLLGEDGQASVSYKYYDFGSPNTTTHFDINWSGPDNLLGYTGYEWDSIAEMWYAKARYYNSDLGRFTAEDPVKGNIMDIQSLNLYPYVKNNPLRYVDLDGRMPDWKGLDSDLIGWEDPNGLMASIAISDTQIPYSSPKSEYAPEKAKWSDSQWRYVYYKANHGTAGERAWAKEQIKEKAFFVYKGRSYSNVEVWAAKNLYDPQKDGHYMVIGQELLAKATIKYKKTTDPAKKKKILQDIYDIRKIENSNIGKGFQIADRVENTINDALTAYMMYYGVSGPIEMLSEDANLAKATKELAAEEAALKGAGEAASLSSAEARAWYLEQEAKIPNLINENASLEQQAKQAFDLRNQFRTQARELMEDRDLANKLMKEEPNLTWEQVVRKAQNKGYEPIPHLIDTANMEYNKK